MAVFAVGDIQGCLDELCAALETAGFDRRRDTLWCVGDLVNRGTQSLDTLRFLREFGPQAVCVLGNHDITLLALAASAPVRAHHQLQDVLDAPDRTELIEWLRTRPLCHYDPDLGYAMVHAGVLPEWTLEQAMAYARELEDFLRGEDWAANIHKLYGAKPRRWKASRTGFKRLRLIANVLTRLRYLDAEGRIDADCKLAPQASPSGLTPWFAAPGRKTRKTRIVFGHWSTLGYHAAHNVWGIDTGCVWGRSLTVLRLDAQGPKRFKAPCPGYASVRSNSR